MRCPKCEINNVVKNGNIRNKQRYKCTICNHQFVLNASSKYLDYSIVRSILHLYLEGLSQREIGRLLGISIATVNFNIHKRLNLDANFQNKNKMCVYKNEMIEILKKRLSCTENSCLMLIDCISGSTWLNGYQDVLISSNKDIFQMKSKNI